MSANNVSVLNKERCCGCSACAAICPVDAITMMLDADGYYYPTVDQEACRCCGLCVKVCVHFEV